LYLHNLLFYACLLWLLCWYWRLITILAAMKKIVEPFAKGFTLIVLLALIVIVSVSFMAAQKDKNFDEGSRCGKQMSSKANGAKSHFFGISCNNCHGVKADKADGCFSISGSVYDEARARIHKNPVIKLYTEQGAKGKLVAVLYGDANGNFYSTQKIDYSQGLYPSLYGTPGTREPEKHMTRMTFTGDCNKCHGKNVEALGID
jgi:hypothetical protein